MRDLSVEGDSTCLQATFDPFGRTVTSVAGSAYRGVAAGVPGAYREKLLLLVPTRSMGTPIGRSASPLAFHAERGTRSKMNLLPLNLYLFGPLRMELNGAAVVSRRRKAQALLAYLAVTGQPHSRDALATLLWPEFSQSQARANLRRELAELRGLLGEARLVDDRVTVALNTTPPFALDLTDFQQHLAQARQCLHPGHPTATAACPTCLPHLRQAAARYTADFLAGFTLPDSPPFDDWHFFQADGLRQTLAQLLERLVQGHHAAQQFTEAIPFARRWVALDPLHEPAHCQLMLVYELAGQHAAALRQYETCVRVLDEELGVPPAAETTALYEQIRQRIGEAGQSIHLPAWSVRKEEERSAEAPPSAPPPFQAPAPPPHFVGRDAEITQLCAALLQPNTPIYALVGMGGAGKTTLAMQVAHLLRDDFRDGVLWANAVSSDPLDIAAAWARAYGYDFGGLSDLESRAAALRGVLAEKAVLIVLDNVEQSSGIRPLLPSGNHCAVLLTTRDLDAAHALNAQVLFLGELSAVNSRQLLVAILGAVRVTSEEEAAAAIGALLHYLPLAVEIVAQRLRSRPRQRLSQLVARLQDEAQRLDLEISDRAVRASFAVSWAALDESLQRCFSLLGIFAGRPFAAEAIAYLADAGLDATEEWLFALEALSLVKAEGERDYRQHPLLADFAHEKLAAGETLEAVQARMATYYQLFAQQYQADYSALDPEWENIMAGMHTAHALGEWQLVLAYVDTLGEAWFIRARYTDARQAFELAGLAATALGDTHKLAACLHKQGEACFEQSDYAQAAHLLSRSIQIFQQLDNEAAMADLQCDLAKLALEQGHYDEAQQLLIESRHIKEKLGDRMGIAAAQYGLARVFTYKGDDEKTEHFCRGALEIQDAIDDQLGALQTLRILASVCYRKHDYYLAQSYGERALVLCEALGEQGELAPTLYHLSMVYRRQGNLHLAQEYAEEALKLSQSMGNRKLEALTLYSLSIVKEDMHEYDSALELGLKSQRLLRTLQDNFSLVYLFVHLGDLYKHFNQIPQANAIWQDGLALAEAGKHPLLPSLQVRLGYPNSS